MADKLLVRAYDVEVGDCIYCRIPKAQEVGGKVDDFHILIDCGSVGGIGSPEGRDRRSPDACCPMPAAARSASTCWW